MAKNFAFVEASTHDPSTPIKTQTATNWKLCIIFQENTKEPLTCPTNPKWRDVGSGYSSLAEQLIWFDELKQLPFPLKRLNEGCGIETTMVKKIVLNVINPVGSSTIIPNYKEQKRKLKGHLIKIFSTHP